MTDEELNGAVAREVMGREPTPDWEPSKNLTHAFVAMDKAAGKYMWSLLHCRPGSPQIYKCVAAVPNYRTVEEFTARSSSAPRALSLCALAVVRGRES